MVASGISPYQPRRYRTRTALLQRSPGTFPHSHAMPRGRRWYGVTGKSKRAGSMIGIEELSEALAWFESSHMRWIRRSSAWCGLLRAIFARRSRQRAVL